MVVHGVGSCLVWEVVQIRVDGDELPCFCLAMEGRPVTAVEGSGMVLVEGSSSSMVCIL